MSTHVTSLTLDGLDKLSAHARRCVFWEMDPAAIHSSRGFCDQEFEKEAWLSMVMLEWGSCGQVAVMDGKPVGSALYAPHARCLGHSFCRPLRWVPMPSFSPACD